MTAEGHKVASLHGAKDAGERDAIIDSFREGREKVLITTNVIARGIDILQVNMVVNYDLPLMNERGDWKNKTDLQPDIETYIHRIGQSAVESVPARAPVLRDAPFSCRSHRAVRAQGYFHQLCARQEDVAADGGHRAGHGAADRPDRDERPRRDGGGAWRVSRVICN